MIGLAALRWAVAVVALGILSGPAVAAGNMAARATNLDLTIKSDLTMSQKEYTLETGKYYHWTITSEGGDDLLLMAPELWRYCWIDRIAVEGEEVQVLAIYGIQFDDDGGTAEIWFLPIHPGNYDFYFAGHKDRGLAGQFVIR